MQKAVLATKSKAGVNRVVRWVGSSPERLALLVGMFVKGEPELRLRAGWSLTYCAENNPTLIRPHLKKLIHVLRERGLHGGVKRSVVRFLQYIDIPVSLQGEVFNRCFGYFTDPGEAIAVRCFSLTVLTRMALNNPELRNELRLAVDDHLPYATAGLASRARRTLKELAPDT